MNHFSKVWYYGDIEKIENLDTFIKAFGMNDISKFEQTIKLTYFSFTTLSTIGFGDLHPRNSPERILCAFMMLFGVMSFSLVMGTFVEILTKFKNSVQDIGDAENLEIFLSLIKKLNGGKDVEIDFRKRIENFFDYKWQHDKNQAIDDPDEI